MVELLVGVTGGLVVLAGLAWRFRFHRTGIPTLRSVLADPDPKVRAAAVDQIGTSVEAFAPELVNLARRERVPEVNEALARLVDRLDHGPATTMSSADLTELRDRIRARSNVDGPLTADQAVPWRSGRAAELLAQLEQALGDKVTRLRVLTPAGMFDLKSTKERQ